MKAMVHTKYGGPEVLKLKDTAKPQPKDDEVLVNVRAASINDWDLGLLTGDFINRLMYGLRKPKKQIVGSDIAGIVEIVGKDIKKFKPGDEVFGDLSGTWGGFAEYVCAKEKMLELKSPAMSFEQAASIPQAGMLAVQGLLDHGNIRAGQNILINGAGGGVGTFAIQIARSIGINDITAVDSGHKSEMLLSIGATNVIDYRQEDFTGKRDKYDLILDAKTNRPMFHYLRVLKPGGKYITVGGSLSKLLGAFVMKPFVPLFTRKKYSVVVLKPNKDLVFLNQLFEDKKMVPVIEGPFKLEELPRAFSLFQQASHKGKIVITI